MPLSSWTGVYGEEVTLAEAERQAPFEISLLPESLGEPDLVYRAPRSVGRRLVITAVYGDDARRPRRPHPVGVRGRPLPQAARARRPRRRARRRPRAPAGSGSTATGHVVFYLGGRRRGARRPRALLPGTSSSGRRATSATGSRPASAASGPSSSPPSSARRVTPLPAPGVPGAMRRHARFAPAPRLPRAAAETARTRRARPPPRSRLPSRLAPASVRPRDRR